MTTATDRLKQLLSDWEWNNKSDLKSLAMKLAREGADITVVPSRGTFNGTLLHMLVCENTNGVYDNEIAELAGLNPKVLEVKDRRGRTPLQHLLDDYYHKVLPLDTLKRSGMALARAGADMTVHTPQDSSGSTLLQVLACENKMGVNNAEIAELATGNTKILESKDKRGRTALQSLMDNYYYNKDLDTLRQSAMALAKAGADLSVQASNSNHPTILPLLVRENVGGFNDETIDQLVKSRSDIVTIKDKKGRTVLQALLDDVSTHKCTVDYLKRGIKVMATAGADLTVQSTIGNGSTVFHVLCNGYLNDDEVADLAALKRGVLESKDKSGRTALQTLLDNYVRYGDLNNTKQSIMSLARAGADLTVQSNTGDGFTLLHAVARRYEGRNDNIYLDQLIALNKNLVDCRDGAGRTPVHFLLTPHPEVDISVIKKLLPTNLATKDNGNATLMHAACRAGNLPLVIHLREQGLSLSERTKMQETLLHFAVSTTNRALLQWLIDSKQIDINAKDKAGNTALHRAVQQHNTEAIRILVANGANTMLRNNQGQTASQIALKEKLNDLLPVLFRPKEELAQYIKAMRDYGVSLKGKNASKGQVVITLADDLSQKAALFFAQSEQEQSRHYDRFKSEFSKLLNSKNKEMSAYRVAYRPIIKNIAIAVTLIGLLCIAAQLVYSKVTEGRALFFFQKNKTTREEKIADVQQAIDIMEQVPRK